VTADQPPSGIAEAAAQVDGGVSVTTPAIGAMHGCEVCLAFVGTKAGAGTATQSVSSTRPGLQCRRGGDESGPSLSVNGARCSG